MRRHALRHVFESLLAHLALAVIPRLSRRQVLAAARFLGRAAYALSPALRRVGAANLDLAFRGQMEPASVERTLRASFDNFALAMLDTFWFSAQTTERIRSHIAIDEEGYAALMRPGAAICITAHLGNWEVLGMALAARGAPLVSVAAPLDNPAVDRLFNRVRHSTGQHVVSKHGAMRAMLRALRAGQKIALVLDQNTKPRDGGIFVPFFGLPVPMSSAAAALWQRTGAAIYVGISVPTPSGDYSFPAPLRIAPPAPDDPDAAMKLTRRIAETLEEAVRRNPGHWLWMYKRWKYIPAGWPREGYPFYAKFLTPD